MVLLSKYLKEMFAISVIVTILVAGILGYTLGEVIEAPQNYVQFLAILVFTGGVFIFGRALFSTFMRMDMPEWNLFSFGIYLLFVYGVASLTGMVFGVAEFVDAASILLPFSLLLMVISLKQIYEPFRGLR